MGGFYGSIQFRSDDRDAVLRLAAATAKERACKFLCGPALGGWIGLYPSGNGQDESVTSALAEKWPGELLYLLVHDDDVFVYRYFRAGQRVDAYWSAPGYFGDDSREDQDREAGNPDSYAHLVGGRLERVKALLDRSEGSRRTLELERLLEFAKLLGIANAGSAYEYLENGERTGIRRWRQFVHIPDRADERSIARRAKAARNAEHKRLIATGLLLAVVELRDRRMPAVVEFRDKRIAFDESTGKAAAHPSDSYQLTATIDSIEIRSRDGTLTRTLLVGSQSMAESRASDRGLELLMLAPSVAELEPGQALATLLGYVPPDRRVLVESHLRRVLPPPPWSGQQAQHLAQIVTYSARTCEGGGHLSFSNDGAWVVCCTGRGLRVAAWSDVLATRDGSSVPWRYTFDVPPHELVPNPSYGMVYAAVYDTGNDCIVFGGIDGRLRRMWLTDGHVDEFLELYARAPVLGMHMVDASTLALLAEPEFPRSRMRAKGPKPLVYVWNYAALSERARSGIRPTAPPLEPHALVPIGAGEGAPPSLLQPVIAALRAAHERAPREVKVERAGECDWPEANSEQRLVAPLTAAGFSSSERFVVPALAGTYIQFFAHPKERIVGTLARTQQQGTTLTLSCVQSDGTSFACTSAPSNGLDLPPGRVVRHAMGVDAGTLLELLKRHRPEGPWLALNIDDLPKRYESNYAKHRAWRNEHGFSTAEAMGLVGAQTRMQRKARDEA